jgi:LysR family nitrogen assimilation transcriptional regulator
VQRIDLKQLHYFITVAELGSFSKASARLSVAQPALSRQISSLEKELGENLLYRNGRGIVLTESGQKFLSRAREVANTFSLALNELSSMRDSPVGQTTIGLPPTVSVILAAHLVRQFRTHFPQVTLRVVEGLSGNILEWLANGRVDVAVLYDVPCTSTLVTEPLIEEELVLVGSRDREDKPSQAEIQGQHLSRLPLILPSANHGLRMLLDGIAGKSGWKWSVNLEIDALPVILTLVEEGVGYTILPPSALTPRQSSSLQTSSLQTWTITKPRMARKLIVATTTQRPMTLATRHLAILVRQLLKKLSKREERDS